MPKSRGRKKRKKVVGARPPTPPPPSPQPRQPPPPSPPAIPSSAPQPSPQRPQRRLWRVGKLVFGVVVAAAGLLASAYQLGGGPPWPASPEIEPGAPAYSPPFSIPFQVRNPSSIFSMQRPIFECEIENLKLSEGTVIQNLNTQIADTRGVTISPKGTHPFKCWFPLQVPQGQVIVGAKLNIEAQWRIAIPFLGLRIDSWMPAIGPFNWGSTLVPPRWIKGEPLR